MLVEEFAMDPEAVMRMPFRRFLAWQKLAYKRSVERKSAELKAQLGREKG